MFLRGKVAFDAVIPSLFQNVFSFFFFFALLLPAFNTVGGFVLDLVVDLKHLDAAHGHVYYSCSGWSCWLGSFVVRAPCLRPLLFYWSLNSELCKDAPWIKGQRLGEKRVKQKEVIPTCWFCSSLVLLHCGACSEASRSRSYFKNMSVVKHKSDHHFFRNFWVWIIFSWWFFWLTLLTSLF